MKKIAACFISFIFILPLLSSIVFADEDYSTEPIMADETAVTDETVISDEGLIIPESEPIVENTDTFFTNAEEVEDNDELLMEYMEISVFDRKEPMFSVAGLRNLTDIDGRVYGLLKACAAKVAKGEESSTIFTFSKSDLGLDRTYSATDLGVLEVVSGGVLTEDAVDAMAAKIQTIDLNRVNTALLYDCPMEFYWYEKSIGCNMEISYGFGATYDYSIDDYVVYFSDTTTVSFYYTVAEDYAINGASGTYMVDSDIIASIQTAIDHASEIIMNHASENDYQKLVSYKEEICGAVSYNTAAGDHQYEHQYGNPWQLIWVFDENPYTDVVCEGYAKAFQFLCDGSTFNSGKIESCIVTGTMSGGTGAGGHMWNIVTMDDSRHYLVDVTNCDEGTIGAPDKLFLVPYTSINSLGTYTFDCDGLKIEYTYYDDTTSLYGADALSISALPYQETCLISGFCGDNLTWILEDGVLTISGTGTMYDFPNESGVPWYDHRNEITSVVLKDSITSIGKYAFYYCDGIMDIQIPGSLTSIGVSAFDHCDNLTDVYYDGTEKQWNMIDRGNYTLPETIIMHFQDDSSSGTIDGTCGDNLTWTLDESGTLTIRGYGAMDDWYLVENTPWYYKRELVKKVVIEEGIESIGYLAFIGCDMTAVELPSTLTEIGPYAFDDCISLNSIEIPANVTSIGEAAFLNCSGLTSISVNPNNMVFDSRDNCNAIIETESNTLIAGCDNTIIPYGITGIGDCAFQGRKLTTIEIPSSVTSIGWWAFGYCRSLTSIELPPNLTSIGAEAFARCNKLMNLTIPSNVTSIGDSAFYECYSLTSINIPDNVTRIGDNTFFCCYSLTDIMIPGSVTSLGDYSFYNCSNLQSVSLSNGLQSIERVVFGYCSNLKYINIPESVTNIGEGAFLYCNGLTKLTLPDSLTNIDNSAFSHCEGLTSMIVPDGITRIGRWTFSDCKELICITIPESVTEIGQNAFLTCDKLTDIYFSGTEEQWAAIVMEDPQLSENVTIHYNGIHDHRYKIEETKDATCSESGFRTLVCIVCGNAYTEDIPAEHKWKDEYTVDKVATCTAEGQKSIHCSVCGEVKEDSVEVIPAKGHIEESIPGKEATCTEPGLTEGKECSVCGEILKAQETVPALGHDFIYHPGKAATCIETSWNEYVTCSRCNYSTYEEIPPLGHSYDENGVCSICGSHLDGWEKDANGIWHYYSDGAAVTGWKKVGSTWYLFNNDGDMLTDWQQVSGVWYYFASSGAMVTGWQQVGGAWYYFKDSGAMVTGWQSVGGTWYYFKDSGAMVTGWQKVGSTWYFFKSSGAMAANEWCEGYWLNADGSWTYQPKGSWKQDSKGWWFGDTSGWYAKNSTVKIDNVNYKFNAAGYWVK